MTNSVWSLSPAPESTSHVQLRDEYGLFINGEFVPSSDGQSFASINPSTEEKIATIAEAFGARCRRGCKGSAIRLFQSLVQDETSRAGKVHLSDRSDDSGTRQRICRD